MQALAARCGRDLEENTMQAEILAGLTDKNDKAACALAERIVAESRETNA